MKFIKRENIDEGMIPSIDALIVFGKRAGAWYDTSWYVIFNSPIHYVKSYVDIARFENNTGVGFNRYMIKYINKNFYFNKIFYPVRVLERVTEELWFQKSKENADSGNSVVGI